MVGRKVGYRLGFISRWEPTWIPGGFSHLHSVGVPTCACGPKLGTPSRQEGPFSYWMPWKMQRREGCVRFTLEGPQEDSVSCGPGNRRRPTPVLDSCGPGNRRHPVTCRLLVSQKAFPQRDVLSCREDRRRLLARGSQSSANFEQNACIFPRLRIWLAIQYS